MKKKYKKKRGEKKVNDVVESDVIGPRGSCGASRHEFPTTFFFFFAFVS
jgi:hypothetical protein